MTDPNDAIINPFKGKSSPNLGPLAVLSATQNDLEALRKQFELEQASARKLFMSRLYMGNGIWKGVTLAGPMIGAPYAVMLMETLIAWGVRKFILVGWCGALSTEVRIGDIIVPTGAFIDEGTSRHYPIVPESATGVVDAPDDLIAIPSNPLSEKMQGVFRNIGIEFHTGLVWSTDAIYRETFEKRDAYQQKGALAVEMEASALFSVGSFRSIDIGAVLVVSDELSGPEWKPGFKDDRFKQGREDACRMIGAISEELI